jgi:hypothetical protein
MGGIHQNLDVQGRRPRECREIVASFQHRDQPPVRVLVGNFRQLRRGPAEIGLGEL